VLSPTTTDEREAWLRRRTPAWAERYGGEWDRAQSLVEASAAARDRQRAEQALARQREEQSKLREQRFKYLRGGSALLGLLLIAAVYFAIQAAREGNRARQETDRALSTRRMPGEAGQILIAANDLLLEPKLELQDLSARYGGTANVRPRHYEIWFNGGLTPGTSAEP
jgi:hypothetical protein